MAATRFPSWEETWIWWSGLANFELKPALPGELKLGRMEAILKALGSPHLGPRVIHVTGTKGKGSTSAMVESVLRACGFRTALYTSPHLTDVTERFQIDGQTVDKSALAKAVNQVRSVLSGDLGPQSLGGPPTFFEVATAAAFVLFREQGCDWIVLEVGLGGRLDSTNVCLPTCCIITSVGLDHTKILGDTVEKIAWEKAGIIKPQIPVISGVTQPPARDVVRQVATDQGASLWELGTEIEFQGHEEPWWEPGKRNRVDVKTPVRCYPELPCRLPGRFQWGNLAMAVAALERSLPNQGTEFPRCLKTGLEKVHWPGRMEILERDPLILADGAHNPDSARALAEELTRIPLAGKRRFLVAISSDKDIPGILSYWAPLAHEFHFTRYSTGSRATSPETLVESLPQTFGGSVVCHESPVEALDRVKKLSQPQDLIVITGSLFLVGEIRSLQIQC